MWCGRRADVSWIPDAFSESGRVAVLPSVIAPDSTCRMATAGTSNFGSCALLEEMPQRRQSCYAAQEIEGQVPPSPRPGLSCRRRRDCRSMFFQLVVESRTLPMTNV